MDIEALADALVEVGRAGNPNAALALPGAGIHSKVVRAACQFRGSVINKIAALSAADRASFAKALAVYENSVGGIGSVTALQYVMRLFPDSVDQGYETFAWITENTRSLWYYSDRAIEFMEPEVAAVHHAAARNEVERRNYELAASARSRRAAMATGNLYNAIRRGDIKAVEALLAKGADPEVFSPSGETLAAYALKLGREEITKQLEAAIVARNSA